MNRQTHFHEHDRLNTMNNGAETRDPVYPQKSERKALSFPRIFWISLCVLLLASCQLIENQNNYVFEFQVVDTENLVIPFANVCVFSSDNEEILKAAGNENGIVRFQTGLAEVRVEISSPFLWYRGMLKNAQGEKRPVIRLEEMISERSGGFTWRAFQGGLKPYLLIPPVARFMVIQTDAVTRLMNTEFSEGRLTLLPEADEREISTIFWFSFADNGKVRMIDISELRDDWQYGVFPAIAVEARTSTGTVVFSAGNWKASTAQPRLTFPSTELQKIGDISTNGGEEHTPDGIINLWDLIYLLTRYGQSEASADLGRNGSEVTMPPNGVFSHNLDIFGPDGKVDIWDLMILLSSYGATGEKINKPFQPEKTTLFINENELTVEWTMPHPNDCHEEFVFFATDSPESFVPNYTNKIKSLSKNTFKTTVTASKDYILLYAYNPDGGFKYFSAPLVIDPVADNPTKPENPSPANNSTGASTSPKLDWDASTDPNEDPVTYDLYLSTSSNPTTLRAGNLSSTS
ncbi:MAG TPA: hypothetical protein PKW59_13865, partial [Thermotogota bacterium]|nr:hypothetical protein [Thermotogota bacterium]